MLKCVVCYTWVVLFSVVGNNHLCCKLYILMKLMDELWNLTRITWGRCLLLKLHCDFSFLLCSWSLLASWNLHWFCMQCCPICFIVQARPLLKTGKGVMSSLIAVMNNKNSCKMWGISGIANCVVGLKIRAQIRSWNGNVKFTEEAGNQIPEKFRYLVACCLLCCF